MLLLGIIEISQQKFTLQLKPLPQFLKQKMLLSAFTCTVLKSLPNLSVPLFLCYWKWRQNRFSHVVWGPRAKCRGRIPTQEICSSGAQQPFCSCFLADITSIPRPQSRIELQVSRFSLKVVEQLKKKESIGKLLEKGSKQHVMDTSQTKAELKQPP